MIVQYYGFRCDAKGCDVEEVDITPMPMDWEFAPPRPVPPKGWTRVNDVIFCPLHTVTVSKP